jgi:hypothetical protein
MIEFPPQFFGLIAALWETYQPVIWIWFALMFAGVVILGFSVVVWSVVRRIT